MRAGLPVVCVPCGMSEASKRRSSEVGSRLACGASLSDKRCQEHLLQAAGVAQQLHVHCAEHLCHRLVHMTNHHHAALCPICSWTATSQRSVPAECWWWCDVDEGAMTAHVHGMDLLCQCLVPMTNHDHATLCALCPCIKRRCQRYYDDRGPTSSCMCANGSSQRAAGWSQTTWSHVLVRFPR